MPSKKAFFAKKEKTDPKGKGSQKRKRSDKSSTNDSKVKRSKFETEEITSESENEEVVSEVESEESDHETAHEKRNRLAKQMLDEIKEKVSHEDGEVNTYLKSQVLETCGRLFHNVADEYECPKKEDIKFCTWSGLGIVTCVVVSSDNKFIFSGCKSGHIVKWSLPECTKLSIIKRVKKNDEAAVGHSNEVKCLALSKDSKFLASGGNEEFVYIWDPVTMKHIYTFKGHRSSIMSLSFQIGSHMLYSGSQDKSIKRWNLDEMAYAETLFGHEDAVMSLDCLATERAVSCGGRDNSVRFWKIPEESHLLFGGKLNNIDCVKFIDNVHFLSASCDNKLAIWSTDSKKHKALVNDAHGTSQHWISSIATLKQHDIVASGCYDGHLRFWKIGAEFKSLDALFDVQLDGYINSLQFSDDGQYVVAGIGKEHRLGRWFEPIKTVKNSVAVIKISKKKTTVSNGHL